MQPLPVDFSCRGCHHPWSQVNANHPTAWPNLLCGGKQERTPPSRDIQHLRAGRNIELFNEEIAKVGGCADLNLIICARCAIINAYDFSLTIFLRFSYRFIILKSLAACFDS
jgi:hypothetical protein